MLQVCCLLMSNLSVPTSSLAVFFCSFKHTCTHPVCQAEARRKARGNPDLVALLEQLADVGSGIPDAPSEAVLCEIILEAQKALHEDHWKTCAVCDEEKPSIALPGQGTLFHMLLPSELPPRANESHLLRRVAWSVQCGQHVFKTSGPGDTKASTLVSARGRRNGTRLD